MAQYHVVNVDYIGIKVTNNETEERILTEQEAADFLRVHVQTLRRKRKTETTLPHLKDGGRYRYLYSDLLAYVHEQRETVSG